MLSVASGTQTATIDTEHSLTTQTGVGVYVLVVDTANMQAGDSLTVRVKTKYGSGGQLRLVDGGEKIFADVQDAPNKYSIPVPVDTEIVCTLTQTAGTGRDYPWSLLRA